MTKTPREEDGYQYFLERTKDKRAHTDENWRLGFELKHRDLNVRTLAENIFSHLNKLSPIETADVVIDIGAGGGALAAELEKIYTSAGAKYIMVDASEVLQLGFEPQCRPIFGAFPNNLSEINSRLTHETGILKHIIANSVLHYVKHDGLLLEFFESIAKLLDPGCASFLGDVPCTELKRAQSIADERVFKDSQNNFSFEDLARLATYNSTLGVSMFTLPQPHEFPMSPHRLDLLCFKNRKSEVWN